MRLRYDCSLEEIAHFTTAVEHIVFALCVTIFAVTLCHFQSPYLQYWLWQGTAQVPTPAPAKVPVAAGRNRAGRRGGWAQRQFQPGASSREQFGVRYRLHLRADPPPDRHRSASSVNRDTSRSAPEGPGAPPRTGYSDPATQRQLPSELKRPATLIGRREARV